MQQRIFIINTFIVLSCMVAVSLSLPFFKKGTADIFSKSVVVKRELPEHIKSKVKDQFIEVDRNGDGSVTVDEYVAFNLKHNNYTSEETLRTRFPKFLKYDDNQNGSVEISELFELLDN